MRSFIYAIGIMRQRSVERPPARLSYEAMVRTLARGNTRSITLAEKSLPI